MAGSLDHITNENGEFTMDLIENMGDAYEALEDCFEKIKALREQLHLCNVDQLSTEAEVERLLDLCEDAAAELRCPHTSHLSLFMVARRLADAVATWRGEGKA